MFKQNRFELLRHTPYRPDKSKDILSG